MLHPNQVIELAKEIEAGDPIDWSGLPLNRDTIYKILGSSVLEQSYSASPKEREDILLATVVHLVVQNFVLETRLRLSKMQ